MHFPALEPRPIKTAHERANQLKTFSSIGITPVLTIRPFIPGIPASEYVDIVRLGLPYSGIVLGGDLYLDEKGTIEAAISAVTGIKPTLVGTIVNDAPLDFSTDTDGNWLTIRHEAAIEAVRREVENAGKKIFLRSAPAIDWLLSNPN